MKIAQTPFTNKAWVKSLINNCEMTFACCPPPIALGQMKRRKLKPSEQPPPVRFKIKENNNVSERQIEVKPFKDGCEWEVSEFKLIFNSTAKQTGWDTPEKKQANFPCCLDGTAKERCIEIQEEIESANAEAALEDRLDAQQLWEAILNDWTTLHFPDSKENSQKFQAACMRKAIFMDLSKFKNVTLFWEEIKKMNLWMTQFPFMPDGSKHKGSPSDETRDIFDLSKPIEITIEC